MILPDPSLSKRVSHIPTELPPHSLLSSENHPSDLPSHELLEGQTLEEQRGEGSNVPMLMGGIPNTGNSLMEFPISHVNRSEATHPYENGYESIITEPGDSFIEENTGMMIEMDDPRHSTVNEAPVNMDGDSVVWTSNLIMNSQSRVKKGKRCPVCSTRCGNSSKVCSVCHTPFKVVPKGCTLLEVAVIKS